MVSITKMVLVIVAGILSSAVAAPAFAAPGIDKDYVRSLAAPGKTVLVVEYYDGGGNPVSRKGYASASGFKAISPTEFRVDDKTALRLYGVEACKGDMVNRTEDYAGTCSEFAQRQLQVMVQSPKVLFCRAFLSEQNASIQNATCYGYYNYPGSLDSVDMLEEQLLSLGAVRLVKKTDGTVDRPDLLEAEKIGRKGSYGMWADPRIKGQ